MSKSPSCPCGSGVSYARCCRPLHRGEREAESAEQLMRSRYAAFAEKQAEYLWETLHPGHEDRAIGHDSAVAAIKETAAEHRYVGLTVLDTAPPDEAGLARVLFHARVFRKGVDRSFVELSEFARADGLVAGAVGTEATSGWRYLRGEAVPAREIAAIPGLTIASFRSRG